MRVHNSYWLSRFVSFCSQQLLVKSFYFFLFATTAGEVVLVVFVRNSYWLSRFSFVCSQQLLVKSFLVLFVRNNCW